MEKPKFGSKSSEDPNKRHFFKWSGKRSGEGVGTCLYCPCKMKFKEDGPRGGKVRMYSKDGKSWGEKEPQCHVREHAVAAKSPAKKNGKKKAAKKTGTKRSSAGAKKKAVANKSPRKAATKKRATKKKATAPAAEAAATT